MRSRIPRTADRRTTTNGRESRGDGNAAGQGAGSGDQRAGRSVPNKRQSGSPIRVMASPARPTVNPAAPGIQRFSGESHAQAGALPATVDRALAGSGTPLEPALRQDMEARFGHDFSGVRLHADAAAEQSAQDVNAEAYTSGQDIVFGAGRFAPGTGEGRRLIAHELTHVVQQSRGSAAPGIQRRLLVTGTPPDVRALFNLLEAASGFTLAHDPKSKEVSITAARLKPASAALAGRLSTIINDPQQDAELNLGRTQKGVSFGAFPESGPLIQQIRIDHLADLEAGAPGNGVAYIAHEMVENYHAHSLSKDFSRMGPGGAFSQSHAEALEAERIVAGELVKPGARVADATVDKGGGVVRTVRDYESYFLVYDGRLGGDTLTNARQSPRVNVGTYTIDGLAKGSSNLPSTAQQTIAAIANALATNPAATVRVQTGGRDPEVALRRAVAVQEAILDSGKDRRLRGFDLRSSRNFNLVTSGQTDGRVVIIVDQPDTEVEELRGSVVKKWLADKRQRSTR